MKKLVTIALLLVVGLGSLSWANKACETPDGEFNIMISPNTLILSSLCDTITVHSNIPYGAVVTESVAIEGVDVPYTKADSLGDLVAKIGVDDLAGFLQPGQSVTLTLSGLLVDGTEFSVGGIITVKE